jgi:hypothetical protein
VAPEEQKEWADGEIVPLLRQLRDAANRVVTIAAEVATVGDGAWTTIYTTEDLAENSIVGVEWWVLGGGTIGAGKFADVRGAAMIGRESAGAGVGGTASLYAIRNPAGYDVQFIASGNAGLLQVKDDGATAAKWKATVFMVELGVES